MKKKCAVLTATLLVLITLALGLRAQMPSPTPAQAKSLPPTSNGGNDDDVLRIDTTLVTLPVSVMDGNGRYVPHLRQEDFRIYEDGVEQQIAHFSTVEQPFTIALLLDASGSTRFRFRDIQAAASALVDQLRSNDQVIVISFGDKVRILSEATANKDVLRRAINQVASDNGTHLYDALDITIHQQLNRIPGRKAVIVFTDGVDNVSWSASYASSLHDVQESEALIYSVQYDTFAEETTLSGVPGILSERGATPVITGHTIAYPQGFGPKEYERATAYMREVARRTGGRYYHADNLQTLKQAFGNIAEELRWQYSLGYYPKPPGQDGQPRQISVKVNRRGVVTRVRRSYIYASSSRPTS
jgi:VWFA-related protein